MVKSPPSFQETRNKRDIERERERREREENEKKKKDKKRSFIYYNNWF